MAPEGGDERLVFDPELLRRGADLLVSGPDRLARNTITALSAEGGPRGFGTVPGGTEAAGRVQDWVNASSAEMARVGVEIEDLGRATRNAGAQADEVDPATRRIASSVPH